MPYPFSMAYTQTQLDAIEAAIAEGVTTVKYENKEVTYRSLEEMIKIRDIIRADLGLTSRGARRYASFSKGLNGCE